MKKITLLLCLLASSFTAIIAQNDTVYPSDTLVDPSFFSSSNILVNWSLDFCPIDTDGTDTTFAPCYTVTYEDFWDTNIDLCPDNMDSVGGFGLHLGDPYLLDSSLFNQMELDGSNIINDTNNYWINFKNLTSGVTIDGGGSPMSNDYCIEADLFLGTSTTWYQSFKILAGPIFMPSPQPYSIATKYAIMKEGILIESKPPSSEGTPAGMGGIIPVDYCGWHPEPAGFGHFHAVPVGIDTAIAASGYPASRFCSSTSTIDQENGYGLAGFTFDGVPLYGPFDSPGTVPTGLDPCDGHTHATPEFPGGVYHYHVSATDIINNPPCRKGYICLEDNFTYGEWIATEKEVQIENDQLLKIYPNPADKTLHIVGEHSAYTIYDIDGKEIFTKTLDGNAYLTKIDLEEFPNGIYILTAEHGQQYLFEKFIVQH